MNNSFQSSAQSNNPWFVISIGLVFFMLGYGVNGMNLFSGGSGGGAQYAQVPSAPTPPPAPAADPEEPAPSIDSVPEVDPDTDHIRGNLDATISLIEYSDYECPFCKRHHPTMTQVMDAYGDDVNWVYRHYPLSFHPNAEPGALAGECVAELGGNDAFWEFTDKVFAGTSFDFAGMAKEIGINEAQFKDCFDSKRHLQKIQDQMAGGSSAGVNGTPGTIIINHDTDEVKLVSGAVPFATFKAAIDGMLN
ncbi:thioredoxin domain-containing protein [Candidatus Peregrinibacteria bacterium]|nr:thioredoxin domain-containing protein [Candidatus Peregrinibacteria bacterium]